MGIYDWVLRNWFEIIGSFANGTELFTIRRERSFEKVRNRIIFTEHHRALWARHDADPKLWRVKREYVDLVAEPLTLLEEHFVRDLFHHLANTFIANKKGVLDQPEALPWDIQLFFNLPIPKAVWAKSKVFHDKAFVTFVDFHIQQTRMDTANALCTT